MVADSTSTETDRARDVFAHPGVDWPTIGLCALMWSGLVANFAATSNGAIPFWASVPIGVFFLNMSFTVWHEGVHGTVFRSRVGNDVIGVLGAFPAMIPYFMIRTVHQLHHEHTNDPERDPDYWFTEAPIWSLPFRYLGGIRRARETYVATRPPAWEGWADRAQTLAVLALFGIAAWQGVFMALVWAWILPKLVAMWIHAWYVNYLPHRELPAQRFGDTRIFPLRWLSPWMLCHNYHGLHHAWQTVPWHRYGRAFRAKADFLAERGTPVRHRLGEL